MNSSFLVSARMIGIYHLLRHKFGMRQPCLLSKLAPGKKGLGRVIVGSWRHDLTGWPGPRLGWFMGLPSANSLTRKSSKCLCTNPLKQESVNFNGCLIN